MKKSKITLSCGSGGRAMQELIQELFLRKLGNRTLNKLEDAAELRFSSGNIAFTTDAFVVQPLFFPNGDIGRLAICGTVNDLAVKGALPKAISAAFIIEEGFERVQLERIVDSMALAAKEAKVEVVTGDTKVVERGNADGVFITTAGIGIIPENIKISSSNVKEGDTVIISGTLGDHSAAIISARENFGFSGNLASDCVPLNGIIEKLLNSTKSGAVRMMRDPTRGGLAGVLNEIAQSAGVDIEIFEEKLPVKTAVRNFCEILGIDPLYLANEGKFAAIVEPNSAEQILKILRKHPNGKDAEIIGKVHKGSGKAYLRTLLGTTRLLPVLEGDPLPRIC